MKYRGYDFLIALGNMYAASQVHKTELFALDNYLSQWEKNLNFGKDVFCGVMGMLGGAG